MQIQTGFLSDKLEATKMRIRLKYSKDETLAYISHRELLSFMMRVLRKAKVPVALSQGYSPKPRITIGPALSLGIRADNEPVDVELELSRLSEPSELLTRLIHAGNPLRFFHSLDILEPDSQKITKLTHYARYFISVIADSQALLPKLTEAYTLCLADKGVNPDKSCVYPPQALNDNTLLLDIPLTGDYAVNILKCTQRLQQISTYQCSDIIRNCLLDKALQPI